MCCVDHLNPVYPLPVESISRSKNMGLLALISLDYACTRNKSFQTFAFLFTFDIFFIYALIQCTNIQKQKYR